MSGRGATGRIGHASTTSDRSSERIEQLRQHALEHPAPGIRSDEGRLHWFRGWVEAGPDCTLARRRALARAYQLAHATPVIDTHELIVGKPCYRTLSKAEQRELERYVAEVEPEIPPTPGQASHMAIDYERLLSKGIRGVREDVVRLLERAGTESGTDDQRDFYECCLVALDSMSDLAARYAEHAGRLADREDDPSRRRELRSIAEILSSVPCEPAETFREAIQSVHFVTAFLEGLYQLGRPDRYLIEFYRNDIATGRIDGSTVQELIDCVCVLFNEYIPPGLAIGMMVGGTDAEGETVCNELTSHVLESIAHTRMIYPGIGLCCIDDMPEEIITRACELLRDGNSHPALFNDRVIVDGLMSYGLPRDEACEYIHSTCVEITPIASSAVWVASPYINLTAPLLEVLGVDATREEADPSEDGHRQSSSRWTSFDDFTADYRIALARKVEVEVINQNRWQETRAKHGGDALVSCFVRDCLERGRDVDWGGARHNWIMPSFVGMANLIDSLAAIRALVFEKRSLRVGDIVEALEADFAGNAAIQCALRDDAPKYGNDDDTVDALAIDVTRWIRETLGPHRTFRGDRFIPSLFCWVMHERLGATTPATPDGRPAGFPLGDGSGPAQGREFEGPTASILSSTKWDHAPFIGGIAVNLKMSRQMFPEDSVDSLVSLAKTFLDRGGFELQVNVVSRETLIEAQAHPEMHADLVVRIGGYSDYFTRLSRAMQDEVILRTEHG